jgi:hypothetical protein
MILATPELVLMLWEKEIPLTPRAVEPVHKTPDSFIEAQYVLIIVNLLKW